MMGVDRRKFLKIAGLSVVAGMGGKAAMHILAPGELEARMESLPLTAAKRWAMAMDLRYLDDEIMEACIKACHETHNVPDLGDVKEEIKWIWKEEYHYSFPAQHYEYVGEKYKHQEVLLLCNHCTNPPCCRVCPTKATWQRELDGLVMMDQHRCIGCRFCMAACPYGARSFNYGDPRKMMKDRDPGFPPNLAYPVRSKGVVEKCTFCAEKLAMGEYPACVEAAKEIREGVLVFGDIDDPDSDVRKILKENFSLRRKKDLGTGPNVFYII